MPRPENAALYKQYQALADATPGVHFVGRLGDLQVLQHGSGRRAGADALREDRRRVAARRGRHERWHASAATAARAVGRRRVHGQPRRRPLLRSARAIRPRRARSTTSIASPRSGIRALRYPVLWERLAPDGLDAIDWRWTDERLGAAARARHPADRRAAAPRQRAGVHVAARPARFPSSWRASRGAVAERYPWVDAYTPVNEPLTTARFSGAVRPLVSARAERRDVRRARCSTSCAAWSLAMRAIREVNPDAAVQTEDCGQTFGTPATVRPGDVREPAPLADVGPAHRPRRRPRIRCWRYLRSARALTAELRRFFVEHAVPARRHRPELLPDERSLPRRRLDRYPPTDARRQRQRIATPTSKRCARDRQGIVGHERICVDGVAALPMPVGDHRGAPRLHARGADALAARAWRGARAARAPRRGRARRHARGRCSGRTTGTRWSRASGHYEPGAFDVRGPQPRADRAGAIVIGSSPPAAHPRIRRSHGTGGGGARTADQCHGRSRRAATR